MFGEREVKFKGMKGTSDRKRSSEPVSKMERATLGSTFGELVFHFYYLFSYRPSVVEAVPQPAYTAIMRFNWAYGILLNGTR